MLYETNKNGKRSSTLTKHVYIYVCVCEWEKRIRASVDKLDKYWTLSKKKTKLKSNLINLISIQVWDLIEHTLLACIRPKVHKIRGDVQAVCYNPHTHSLLFASEQISFLNLKLR